jgi:starch-binding outer membrane protein, SusD/RagB family
MKSMTRIKFWGLPVLTAAVVLAGCELDRRDPNTPTEAQIVSTTQGITQVAIGLQADYSNQLVDPIYTVGLATDELGAIPEAFESFRKAHAGGEILYSEGPSTNTWGGMYRVIRIANVLIEQSPLVGFGPGTTSGMQALGKFYKGLAFGHLSQIYPAAPINVGPDVRDPAFVPREEVLAHALSLLQEARGHLQSTPPPAEFRTRVLAPGFDLANSIDAMIARFALLGQQYDLANTAAQRVDPNVFSEFRFAAGDVNPLWNMWYNSGNAFRLRARQEFRLEAQPGDQRVDYWVAPGTLAGSTGTPLDEVRRYNTNAASVPVYLPDEMRLIRAEYHARRGETAQALTLLNQVRTPCTSTLPEPVACLPALTAADVPTQQALLDAILRERRYELFLQAVRWSDLRRFGRTTKYQFMPIPITECDRNPNAPAQYCP